MKNALIIAAAMTACTGCATYYAKPLDSHQGAPSSIEQRKAEGLYIALQDLTPPRISLQYFDRDLVEYGYAPALLLLELDQQSKKVFDVRREEIQLCMKDGRRLASADPLEVAEQVSFSHLRSAMGFFFILPGFFLASSVNEANVMLEMDYQEKAQSSVCINPNRSSFRTVIFFKIPLEIKDSFTMVDAFVELKVHRRDREKTVGETLELPVHFTR